MSSYFPAADKEYTWTDKNGNHHNAKRTIPAHFERPYNGCILKYAIKFFPGRVPPNGYPLYIGLHGGGHTSEYANDGEWLNIYDHFFSDPVQAHAQETGIGAIFIAPRGVSEVNSAGVLEDEWKLHFEPEGFVLLEEIIQSWISMPPPDEMEKIGVPGADIGPAFVRGGFCDPDQVYLLGFSAGGDGAFQIGPRMPDRFAGVSVGGGHSNGVGFTNMINLPLLIACGEKDSTPSDPSGVTERALRNMEDHDKLNKLQSEALGNVFLDTLPSAMVGAASGFFPHTYTIIKNMGHHLWAQPDKRTVDQDVVANLESWWTNNKSGIKDVPSQDQARPEKIDPVKTLSSYRRNPVPNFVWWDLSTRPDAPSAMRGSSTWYSRKFNYWLCIRTPQDGREKRTGVVKAAYDRGTNSVWVDEARDYLGLLVNAAMLNLDQPIHVYAGKSLIGDVVVQRDNSIKASTRYRKDRQLVFEAMIGFKKISADWKPESVGSVEGSDLFSFN